MTEPLRAASTRFRQTAEASSQILRGLSSSVTAGAKQLVQTVSPPPESAFVHLSTEEQEPLNDYESKLLGVTVLTPPNVLVRPQELGAALARSVDRPADYDGPIFVCDIDHTLRDTKWTKVLLGQRQPPHPGAKELLQQVADRNIPIVYLTASWSGLRPHNQEFLEQLPPGLLLDREGIGLSDVLNTNENQAERQAEYKQAVLARLKLGHPKAQFFGLGDDQYGDAYAYTRQGVRAYIRDVRRGDANFPANFDGVKTGSYTPEFIGQVAKELDGAIAKSAYYGGTPVAEDRLATLSAKLDRLTGTRAKPGNRVAAHVDGPAALAATLRAINGATRTLYYETYGFLPSGKVPEQVAQALIAAKQRGVEVRVVADAVGSRHLPGSPNPVLQRMAEAGVKVRVYNPVDRLNDVNLDRDHRKVVLADGKRALVGGMNTGDEFLGGPEVPGARHDVSLELTGPVVSDIRDAFLESYAAAGGEPVPQWEHTQPADEPAADGVSTRVVTHAQGRPQHVRATYLSFIDHAQKRINLENPFPLAEDLADALIAAAQRGVEVRYIVGNEQGLVSDATRAKFQDLLNGGVDIYVYPGPVHTKAFSVDGLMASVGSANVDKLSLERMREIIALTEDPKATAEVDAQVFDRDVVGDAQGRKTIKLPKKLDDVLWDRLRLAALRHTWPSEWAVQAGQAAGLAFDGLGVPQASS